METKAYSSPRIAPLPPEHTPELADAFEGMRRNLGFIPNSMLILQRKPKIARALQQLTAAIWDPAGEVDRGLKPGSEGWPQFTRNASEQFEARLSLVQVEPSPSLFFEGMAGSRLPIAVAHGEGRADFGSGPVTGDLVSLRFVDSAGAPAEDYPRNPNGSPGGVTGLCNRDGRLTILMPHPERTLRSVNFSWAPSGWPEPSPWRRMFENARLWVG